jgi:hypothetical protein
MGTLKYKKTAEQPKGINLQVERMTKEKRFIDSLWF